MKDTLIHQALFRYVVTVPPSRRTNALSQIFSQDFEAIVLRGSAGCCCCCCCCCEQQRPLASHCCNRDNNLSYDLRPPYSLVALNLTE